LILTKAGIFGFSLALRSRQWSFFVYALYLVSI
jgi:hypothetical protein